MINCSNARENICAYIDNELGIDERLSFEKHITSCKECKNELDEMSQIVGLCKNLPQQELPVDFKMELHEKLLAVAGRQEVSVKNIKRSKSFLFTKTFASIAAGILLIFLAGSFYRFGLFTQMKAQDSANSALMAAEQPAAAKMDGNLTDNGGNGEAEGAVGSNKALKSYSESVGDSAAADSFEIDRSSSAQNRETALAGAVQMLKLENASNKLSTITITVVDPEVQAEKVKTLALENSGDLAEKSSYEIGSAATAPIDQNMTIQAKSTIDTAAAPVQTELDLIIPQTQYDQFISALNTTFGEANVQIGAFVTEDVTDALNSNIDRSNEIDSRMQELQKKDSEKNSEEISKLKDEKDTVDSQIEKMRLGSDFVNITVLINKK